MPVALAVAVALAVFVGVRVGVGVGVFVGVEVGVAGAAAAPVQLSSSVFESTRVEFKRVPSQRTVSESPPRMVELVEAANTPIAPSPATPAISAAGSRSFRCMVSPRWPRPHTADTPECRLGARRKDNKQRTVTAA